jgi:GTP-binding protein EngB required for normal cell division
VLVDIRRGVEPDDALLLDFLRARGIATLLVATKIDKLPWGRRKEQLAALRARHAGPLVGCSAASDEGVDELRAAIHAWLVA